MKKTKAQLEKELSKVQQKLADTIIKFEKNTNDNATSLHCIDVPKSTDPVLAQIINSLTVELQCQNDLLNTTVSKVSTFDGGVCFDLKKEDKVYKSGVCGVLNQLIDLAQENRNRIEIINSRLTELVG